MESAARTEASGRTANAARQFVQQARDILPENVPANMVLLGGFAARPQIPTMREVYGLRACSIAIYPMYRGLSRLLEMHVPPAASGLADRVGTLKSCWDNHDFFFVHHKDTDSRGEDGDFENKVHCIEQFDQHLSDVLEQESDVLIVIGDHNTPRTLENHSRHPVPVLLSSRACRPDRTRSFREREAMTGRLGQFHAKHLIARALGRALKLDKFRA